MKKRYQKWEEIKLVTIQLLDDGGPWLKHFMTWDEAEKWAKDNGYEAY